MATNNKYICVKTFDDVSQSSFYVRLNPQPDESIISFNQYKNTLQISFNLWLDGTFELPENLFLLKIDSNLGKFSNITLKMIRDNYVSKKYNASFLINLDQTANFKGQHFLEELHLKISLDVNQDVANNSNLPSNFNKFYQDLLKIQWEDSINFNNYFPISKLSEYYISDNYKNDYLTISKLPKDFYKWANKPMTIYPDFWFTPTTNFSSLKFEPINEIYRSNVNEPLFTKNFDEVVISINYLVNNVTKTLHLDLTNQVNNIQVKNILMLGVKTLYNFDTQTLYQSDQGVSGVYFPVPMQGNINVKLVKNSKQYLDNFNFSFSNDFYSDSNTNIGIEVTSFTQTSGQWLEVVYA